MHIFDAERFCAQCCSMFTTSLADSEYFCSPACHSDWVAEIDQRD